MAVHSFFRLVDHGNPAPSPWRKRFFLLAQQCFGATYEPLFLVRSWCFGCRKTKNRFETRLWLRTSTGTALVEKGYERLFLYPIMLPIDLISCKLVLQLFLICTFNFSGLLLLPVPTFLECVALMKSKMSQYLAWHFKMSHFQHLICYLYSIVNKI